MVFFVNVFLFFFFNFFNTVSAFFFFGFQLDSGIQPLRHHVTKTTSDWMGPYNVVMAKSTNTTTNTTVLTSRLVQTAGTEYLKPPLGFNLAPREKFELYSGLSAVQNSIQGQSNTSRIKNPYESYLGTCANGDLEPLLPQFQVSYNHNQSIPMLVDFSLEYQILSIPSDSKKDPLNKLWPAFKKNLKAPNIHGPYCFGGNLNTYSVDVSFPNTTAGNWKFINGCLAGFPCWPDRGGNATIPDSPSSPSSDNHHDASLLTYGCYVLLGALVISLLCNFRMLWKLKIFRREQRDSEEAPTRPIRRRIWPQFIDDHDEEEHQDLAEPLLGAQDAEEEEEEREEV